MRPFLLAALMAALAAPAWAEGPELPEPPPSEWMRQADLFGPVTQSADNGAVVAWELAHQLSLSSGYLFDLSRRLLPTAPTEAMEWYVVAMVRGRYDAGRCIDDTAERAVSRLSGMAAEVLRYGETHPRDFAASGLRALARPDLLSHTISPDWVCAQALSGMGGRSAGIKPPAGWPVLEQRLRQDWGRQFETMAAR